MGKILIIIILVLCGYGAYKHYNQNRGEKIPEAKLTSKQRVERENNKKLTTIDSPDQGSQTNDGDVKRQVPPNINYFVTNQMEQWSQLTPGEKNELRHLSSRIDQRLPFGNYEKTLVQKLNQRNVLEAIRRNNPQLIQNSGNVIEESNVPPSDFVPREDYPDSPEPQSYPDEAVSNEAAESPQEEPVPSILDQEESMPDETQGGDNFRDVDGGSQENTDEPMEQPID